MNKKSLAIKYLCFAALAIFANLGVQRIVFSTGDSHAIYVIAVVVGTAAGLLVKYLLDKTWIFYNLTRSLKNSILLSLNLNPSNSNAQGIVKRMRHIYNYFSVLVPWKPKEIFEP